MIAPENPQAFPQTGNSTWSLEPSAGMTLRDWFAGQASLAPDSFTIAPPECEDWQDNDKSAAAWSDWHVRRAVAWSWAYADAMLAERERK